MPQHVTIFQNNTFSQISFITIQREEFKYSIKKTAIIVRQTVHTTTYISLQIFSLKKPVYSQQLKTAKYILFRKKCLNNLLPIVLWLKKEIRDNMQCYKTGYYQLPSSN
jgi:hypothetical protein